MLASEFTTRQPKGLGKLVIVDLLASTMLWVKAANELRKGLSQEVQYALNKHEAVDTTTDPEYIATTNEFYKQHLCRLDPMPQCLVDRLGRRHCSSTEGTMKHTTWSWSPSFSISRRYGGYNLRTQHISRTWNRRKGLCRWCAPACVTEVTGGIEAV
ncbi:uncharacterized protein HD556DRAFT_526039 [Suillus plorans]|uniref:Uncharacterized protein n=1 Tax=Suillus plorans TaxID=116603 RepID=A0A9P7ANS9_9AGAM|nr:uncharacterized protein HD556DRAFT_526039 [Suillus plorans]KAG1793193.1 hypothetical protein HD556DRAFT_526039 [Suillus plorans]